MGCLDNVNLELSITFLALVDQILIVIFICVNYKDAILLKVDKFA